MDEVNDQRFLGDRAKDMRKALDPPADVGEAPEHQQAGP
jgi:hypothetical protein